MWYKQGHDTLTVNIYAQPGAKRTEIAGFYGDALKIRLASPPLDGRANNTLLNFIAELFEVSRRQVELIRGEKCRYKTVVIKGSKIEPRFMGLIS